MKALVYEGPGRISLSAHTRPGILDPTHAVVRITKTTIAALTSTSLRAMFRVAPPAAFSVMRVSASSRKQARGRRSSSAAIVEPAVLSLTVAVQFDMNRLSFCSLSKERVTPPNTHSRNRL